MLSTVGFIKQLLKFSKGAFTNCGQDEGGRGSKMSVFVHAQGIKTVHTEGGVKNGKILST